MSAASAPRWSCSTPIRAAPRRWGFTPERIDTVYQMSYRAAPHAVVTRVPDTAHFIMFDNPAFFQARLREFLTTPGTPRP